MLNENVVQLLGSSMWDLATCANGEPNVVPVAFKDVTPDGKLVVGDVFLDTTLKNLSVGAADCRTHRKEYGKTRRPLLSWIQRRHELHGRA